ncbi:MAG: sulfatase [Flavicella sp.]
MTLSQKLTFIVLIFLTCSTTAQKTNSKPNIVIINIDDLGWKDVGYMGSNYYETPHIDALAKESMRFDNAYAGAANCAPSRACLLSGKNTPKHGVYTVGSSSRGKKTQRRLIPVKNTLHLENKAFTLPKFLQSNGYETASFGKWHVGIDPSKQGIEFNVGGSDKGSPGKGGYFSPYTLDHIKDGPDGEYLTDRIASEVVNYLSKPKEKPFFLYVPFYSVHTPIQGKKELIEKFKQKKGSKGQNKPAYAAMISTMDNAVGKILTALETQNLSKNTLLFFTSDNGGINFISDQSPLRAGKGSYYEGGIRVPLLIRYPGKIQAGSESKQVVSQLDFFKTIQSIVNPAWPNLDLDGIDIQHTFQGKVIERDLFYHFPIYLQAYKKGKDEGRDRLFRTRPGSVIRSGKWKLHYYYEDKQVELYDLQEDISESTNLAAKFPEKVNELQESLEIWLKNNKAKIPCKDNPHFKNE